MTIFNTLYLDLCHLIKWVQYINCAHKVGHEEIYEDTKFIHKQEREMLQIAIGFRMNDAISVDTIFHDSIHVILCYLQKY